MDLGITGRQALICGASRGLGFACAEALAREGVVTTLVARNRDALDLAAARIERSTGARPRTVVADIATSAGREAALIACPSPDIVVTNAGGPPGMDFRALTREHYSS